MNYNKIEELFVDFILDIIGPNLVRENERNEHLKMLKKIITEIFEKNLQDYSTHIMAYGSFPIKTYIKNADIDVTIFFESKSEKKIFTNMPTNLVNNSILLIKEEFEKYNKNIYFELFSDIRIINADFRLLKCKIGGLSLDISVNNFSGLYKIVLIDYIENQFKSQFNKFKLFQDSSYADNKILIFRRSLLLIKAWCLLEGNLMGSNIGLMASYTLEILVIYVFNLYYEYIYNEFDAFERFFQLMEKIDWENNVISLFGKIPDLNFQKKLLSFNSSLQNSKNAYLKEINEPFWYINKKGKDNNSIKDNDSIIPNEPLLKLPQLKKMIAPINKCIENLYLKKEGKVINSANFDKSINILDPLNNYNNLGKSINFHSKSKMEKVIIYLNQKLKNIREIRKKGNPFLYFNSLLNLFKITLSKNYIDLFSNYINSPRIIADSKLLKISKKSNADKKRIKIDKEDILKFNNLFKDSKLSNDINYFDDEEFDVYEEESEDVLNFEEKDFEDNYEEDEYAEEEEDEKKVNPREIIDEDAKMIIINKDSNLKFTPLINNNVIKKIFEIYDNKQKIIDDNIQLLKISKDYFMTLENFLKTHKLI